MPKVTVKIEGREELKAAFDRLERSARPAVLERAALAGAERIRADAARRAPGPHIEAEVTKGSQDEVEVGIGPDKDHWYYRFFETGAGTHEIKGHKGLAVVFPGSGGSEEVRPKVTHPGIVAAPFLRPAFDGQRQEAVTEVGAVLRREIDRAGAGG